MKRKMKERSVMKWKWRKWKSKYQSIYQIIEISKEINENERKENENENQ